MCFLLWPELKKTGLALLIWKALRGPISRVPVSIVCGAHYKLYIESKALELLNENVE
jgi:hypothetical protein